MLMTSEQVIETLAIVHDVDNSPFWDNTRKIRQLVRLVLLGALSV